MAKHGDTDTAKAGQRTALLLAGVGVFWIVAIWLGGALDLSPRVRGLLDLIALAGFGVALWRTWELWRARRTDKG